MELRVVRDRQPPVPVWAWSKKNPAAAARVARYNHPARKWLRPVLPAFKRPRGEPLKVNKDGSSVYLMRPEDVRRAQVVLGLYIKTLDLERWEDFNEHRWGFDYAGYPYHPVTYAGPDVVVLTCCPPPFKLHRYVEPEAALKNPARYIFCLMHWRRMLRDAWDRKERLSVKGLEENAELAAQHRVRVRPRSYYRK